MKTNPLTQCDFYKISHIGFYPKNCELIYSNFTPRSIKHMATVEGVDDKIVVFGIQYLIKYFLIDVFNENFFSKDKNTVIKQFKRRLDTSLGGNNDVSHYEALYDLGYLPIEIRALEEGSCVPVKIPMLTIHNTIPEFYWLTNYLETALSSLLWKFSTSATTARKFRQILNNYARKTGADLNFVPFQGHDFSFRGMAGFQDAAMSGAAHLLSFVGTDTIPAIDFLEDYYNANSDEELIGCSVPASEHSVMCIGTKTGEFETFKNILVDKFPNGIVSIVSDTWDYWSVLTDFLPRLKDVIMNRDGKAVIRPDSGDPYKIIVGDDEAPEETPEHKGSIQILWEIFGGTETSKGYKLLDSHIGLIYGDSINLVLANKILDGLEKKGFASTNVVLGIGSYTYEYVTRDTLGFAMKATAGIVNGETRLIEKSPKTDTGTKKSACGFLSVTKDDNDNFILHDRIESLNDPLMEKSLLQPVFHNGRLLVDQKLSDIRNRVLKGI